jgi:transposase-like protein
MVAKGQSVAYVSQAIGISDNIIYRWKKKRKGENEEGQKSDLSSLTAENG